MYSMTEVALTDPALIALFADLSQALANTQGEETYKQDFQGGGLLVALIAWHDGKAVGCGLLRREDATRAEIKRLYSATPGVGSALLQALELQAKNQGFTSILAAARILNGKAVNFFLHKHFKKCASYGKYRYSSQTICLEKSL